MKRLTSLFLVLCVLFLLCLLTGCNKEDHFQTVFPLEQEVIIAALEKTNIQGFISESETISNRAEHKLYVVRSPTETQDGTSNSNSKFIAGVNSLNYEGERVLFTTFDQRVESNQIEWEDWKQQIVFATLLYGGFENEEDVYLAFCEKELPDGRESFVWEVELPEGFCRVSYSYRSQSAYDENRFQIKIQSAFLRVNIYESYELYQKQVSEYNKQK